METGFQLVNQNCTRAKMPNTNYKNIFPHWDSQNKRQTLNRIDTMNSQGANFSSSTLPFLYSAYLPIYVYVWNISLNTLILKY